MKAKLIKTEFGFRVDDLDGTLIGSTLPSAKTKLSLRNCQAIERGYDLDELAENYANGKSSADVFKTAHKIDFIAGAKAIIEILADKKFSEKQLKQSLWDLGDVLFNNCQNGIAEEEPQKYIDIIIQSLQQKEWEVEIEMICPHPSDTYVCGIQYGCDEDGCNHPNQVPYLDADGCLILKKL